MKVQLFNRFGIEIVIKLFYCYLNTALAFHPNSLKHQNFIFLAKIFHLNIFLLNFLHFENLSLIIVIA